MSTPLASSEARNAAASPNDETICEGSSVRSGTTSPRPPYAIFSRFVSEDSPPGEACVPDTFK